MNSILRYIKSQINLQGFSGIHICGDVHRALQLREAPGPNANVPNALQLSDYITECRPNKPNRNNLVPLQ